MPNDSHNAKVAPPSTVVEQIRLLVEHANRLTDLVRESTMLAPQLTPDAVLRSLAKSTGLGFLTLFAIFNAIDNLSDIRLHQESSEAAVTSLIAAFGKEKLPGLEENKSQIVAALDLYSDDNPIAISLKARRLAFLREKLFVDAEIITDARPIFNTSGDRVLEYAITHSLVLTYHEDEGTGGAGVQHKHHRVHITLDLRDVLALRKATERAALKGQALLKDLGNRGHILGDDDEV